MSYYYVVATIRHEGIYSEMGNRMIDAKKFGLLISAHPLVWASSINEAVKDDKKIESVFVHSYQEVEKLDYHNLSKTCDVLQINGLCLGLEICRE
jgi:hypothetical protein